MQKDSPDAGESFKIQTETLPFQLPQRYYHSEEENIYHLTTQLFWFRFYNQGHQTCLFFFLESLVGLWRGFFVPGEKRDLGLDIYVMNQNTPVKIYITAEELEHYAHGRRVITRAAIPTTYSQLHSGRLQTFLERYAEHLTVFVVGNKFYYCTAELEALLSRLDNQKNG